MLNKMRIVFAGLWLACCAAGCGKKDASPIAVAEPEPSPAPKSPGTPAQRNESVPATDVTPKYRVTPAPEKAGEPSHGSKSLSMWVEALKGKSEESRKEAVQAIHAIGKPAVEPLVAQLVDPDPLVQTVAMTGLGAVGPPAETAVGKIIEVMLKTDDVHLKFEAAEALGKIGKPAVGPLLDTIGKQTDAWSVPDLLRAVEKIGPPAKAAVPQVVELLRKYEGGAVRAAGLRALGSIGPDAKAALPVVKAALGDRIGFVRQAGAEAYKRIDPDGAKTDGIKRADWSDVRCRMRLGQSLRESYLI